MGSSERSSPHHAETEGPRGLLRRRSDGTRPARWWAIGLVALVAVGASGYWVTKSPLFSARRIEVSGESRFSPADVIRLAGVGSGTNVFWLHAGSIERRLEADRWIAHADVTRSLPSTIRITIRERHPVAQAEDGDRYLLLATDGTVLDRVATARALPIVRLDPISPTKPRDLRAPARVVGMMAGWLRSRVTSVSESDAGDVVIRLDSGVTANYGTPTGLAAKGDAVAAILQWAAHNDKALVSIDVRAPLAPTARLYVPEPAPAPVETPKAGGKRGAATKAGKAAGASGPTATSTTPPSTKNKVSTAASRDATARRHPPTKRPPQHR